MSHSSVQVKAGSHRHDADDDADPDDADADDAGKDFFSKTFLIVFLVVIGCAGLWRKKVLAASAVDGVSGPVAFFTVQN